MGISIAFLWQFNVEIYRKYIFNRKINVHIRIPETSENYYDFYINDCTLLQFYYTKLDCSTAATVNGLTSIVMIY